MREGVGGGRRQWKKFEEVRSDFRGCPGKEINSLLIGLGWRNDHHIFNHLPGEEGVRYQKMVVLELVH